MSRRRFLGPVTLAGAALGNPSNRGWAADAAEPTVRSVDDIPVIDTHIDLD